MYGLKTEASFDSAHFLADYHGKCENLHGHRWRVVAYLRTPELGAAGTERDMVCDFGVFKRAVRELAEEFDHTFLVEEGTLRPGYHYVEVKEDFSDLEEKLRYYIAHPDEAEEIIRHAHEYVDQFRDKERERIISLVVMDKYFRLSGQEGN